MGDVVALRSKMEDSSLSVDGNTRFEPLEPSTMCCHMWAARVRLSHEESLQTEEEMPDVVAAPIGCSLVLVRSSTQTRQEGCWGYGLAGDLCGVEVSFHGEEGCFLARLC